MGLPETADGLVRRGLRAGWLLSLYPEAGEAGGCFMASRRSRGESGGAPSERAAEEAARRARGKVRRYCAANRLNRLGTLTYAPPGCHDPKVARQDVARFFRRLRAEVDVDALPYLWVPEWHKTGHGLHLHFAAGCYLPRKAIERAWGHGFIYIKLLGDLPVGSTSLHEARLAARYLSKYVGKAFDEHRVPGLHRYERAQGFDPRRVVVDGVSRGDVVRQASELLGADPQRVWSSDEQEGWKGPPAVWVQWAA
jgi:hypothetical protein